MQSICQSVLDLRIYRAAFVPAVLALVVVAFSLQARPGPITTTLPPDAFDGPRAARLLDELATRFPSRRPGSSGDLALAGTVARAFRSAGFSVASRDTSGQTIDGERTLRTVVAERPGRVSRRIVVLAHRDAAGSPARAELSGTVALLELARLFAGRTTRRTLTLVSTSGGSGGDAGAADWADHVQGPVDAVIVLGDLAGARERRPQVVGWSDAEGIAPQRLLRTVQDAVRVEASSPGGTRTALQALRLAFPLSVSEQGVIGTHGLPAVLVGASGELGPGASDPVSASRLESLGRAVLRSITAIDNGPEILPPGPQSIVVIRDQALPGWAVRLLAGALLAPALLAALDGLARVRRRREPVLRWVGWVLATGAPFLLAALLLVALRVAGLLAAPAAPVRPGVLGASVGALVAVAAVLALGFLVLWPLAARRLGVGKPGALGSATAVGLVAVALAIVVWLRNPYAALFLVPAAHLWLLAGAPELRVRRWLRALAALAGLAPLALAALAYAAVLDARPISLLWTGALLVAGGHVGGLSLLLWSLIAGCAVAALVVAVRSEHAAPGPPPREVRSRGPITYAGPGSLGGTDSALRR